jgi:hypothetical protein
MKSNCMMALYQNKEDIKRLKGIISLIQSERESKEKLKFMSLWKERSWEEWVIREKE